MVLYKISLLWVFKFKEGLSFSGSKKELVKEMAGILDANPGTLYDTTPMVATEFMELLFWIDEFNPAAINLFQMKTYPREKCNSSKDTAARYHDNDS